MDYKQKYLKYKYKYLKLKGGKNEDENFDFFFNFNTKKDEILNKYEKFYNKDLINSPIRRLGQPSANGFINSINYKNNTDQKTFNTILKTSKRLNADNIYYEFIVGNCINILKKYYPNFCYTFAYLNLDDHLKNELEVCKSFENIGLFKEKSYFKLFKDLNELQTLRNISEGCSNNNKSSVLIEDIPSSISFNELLNDPEFKCDVSYYTFCNLYQIYYTLNSIKKIFTHYDLHEKNVMYLKLNKKIKIIYEADPESVILYTRYIPVIIDYGRCHINCLELDNNIFSRIFSEIACESDKCNNKIYPLCNTDSKGIWTYRKSPLEYFDNKYYTNYRKKNESHDLRYIVNILLYYLNENRTIKKFFKKYVNAENNSEFFEEKYYGTKEYEDCLIETNDVPIGKIKTVGDVMIFLKYFYISNKCFENKSSDDLYGTMKIYKDIKENKPWTFEKA